MEQERTAVCATADGFASNSKPPVWSSNTAVLIYMALATVALHAIVGNRYGFHSDELATLDDARHLAWGYPAYPPVTPFFGRISLILFGTSLIGFRFFASLAHALTVVLAGLMARELGGRRGAQLLAGAAALPFCIGGGALMQYVSFDYAAWVLTAYFVVRLLKSDDPRWWVAVGAGIGFGMLSKYTMAFFAVAIVAGLLLTGARRYLKSKWLWIGVAVAVLIFLPNLLWQVQNHFVSLDFLKYIHARDVGNGKAGSFLPDQLGHSFVPLVLAGLWFYLFSRQGKRFRMLGWMYVVTLLLFVMAKGRSYYMFPAYPMLYAAGAVWGEDWLAMMQRRRRARVIWRIAWAVVAYGVIVTIAYFLPLAPVNSAWWEKASALQETYRGEIGWPELA
jgi:4-amino-4-deoxy-L-arabinose transferase-like glycosyltransferase